MAGTLFVVATPIGNLEDITQRALRILSEVDRVAAEDTRRTRRLLDHFGLSVPVVSVFEHNERARVPGLVRRLEAGERIALVTDAGSPGIADPDPVAAVTVLNQAVERIARRDPAQYQWTYKRYTLRPEGSGEDNPYR